MSNFQQPGIGGDKFEAANHNGHLLLFFPTTFRAAVKTANGEADCVDTRIVDLDTGQVLDDAKVWGKAMVPQLKGAVPDGMVLGRLAQGQGKAGNNPPWILQPHTEQDVYRAEQWIAANPRNQFGQPQGQQVPPTPAAQGGWGAPAPAPASPAPATGGWGAPAPTQGGWGAPAPAAQSAPAAPAQSQFEGQWGNAAPSTGAPAAPGGTPNGAPAGGNWGAPPPPAAPQIDPGLVAALQQRGVDPAQLQNQAHAEQIAAAMGLTRS